MFGFFYRLLGAVVVIAANAGGAWTPIGDVTTTMLWIHGQISTLPTMKVFIFILLPKHLSLGIECMMYVNIVHNGISVFKTRYTVLHRH